jgi:hypothetical protein
MKKTFWLLILGVILVSSSCVLPGTATVSFVNHAGFVGSPILVNFYLDGAMMSGSPFGYTTSLLGNQWAGLSPGSHVLGASVSTNGRPTTTQAVNLTANQFYTWTITSSP